MRGINRVKQLIATLLICCAVSSCGLSRLDEKLELGQIESIELKGLTMVELKAELKNDSRYKLEMSQGLLNIFIEGREIMELKQVGESVAMAKSDGVVSTRWRVGGVDPLTMIAYSKRLVSRDFSGMTVNYSAKLTANGIGKTISGEGVDLTKFMTIFAKQSGNNKKQ